MNSSNDPDNPTQTYHHGNLREAIITAALDILNDEGIDAVTMREIARRIGVSHSASYRHFKNKEAVLAAIARSGFEELAGRLKAIRKDETLPSRNRFRLMGVEYITFAVNNAAQYRLMYGSDAMDRELFPDLQGATMSLSREVLLMIKACQDQRSLRDGSTRQLTQAVWSISHGAAMLVIDGFIRVDDLEAFANQMTYHIRSGIAWDDEHN